MAQGTKLRDGRQLNYRLNGEIFSAGLFSSLIDSLFAFYSIFLPGDQHVCGWPVTSGRTSPVCCL